MGENYSPKNKKLFIMYIMKNKVNKSSVNNSFSDGELKFGAELVTANIQNGVKHSDTSVQPFINYKSKRFPIPVGTGLSLPYELNFWGNLPLKGNNPSSILEEGQDIITGSVTEYSGAVSIELLKGLKFSAGASWSGSDVADQNAILDILRKDVTLAGSYEFFNLAELEVSYALNNKYLNVEGSIDLPLDIGVVLGYSPTNLLNDYPTLETLIKGIENGTIAVPKDNFYVNLSKDWNIDLPLKFYTGKINTGVAYNTAFGKVNPYLKFRL